MKGTPAYLSPETYEHNEYSKKSDVYSYSHILYEILTNEKIYSEFTNSNEIKTHILTNHLRPIIRTPIPKAYHNLIERCWDENPSKRPSFEEIITELRTNPEFITDSVDK